jgi:trimeric autotransporter adhesin
LGEGVNGAVRCIGLSGSNLFVAGQFTEAGGIPASKVARWDGIQWSSLGDGIVTVSEQGIAVGDVDSLVVDGANVIVGGRFRKAGSIGATNIARWTGSEWAAFGNELRQHDIPNYSENGAVRALTVLNGVVYAGENLAWLGISERRILHSGDLKVAGRRWERHPI